MRKIGLISILMLLFLPGMAQQEPMYSMYMFNGLAINPAYAGSREQASFTMLHRAQWVGIDQAPSTSSFSMHAPTADLHHGWGVSVIDDRAGFTNDFYANFTYAYRIHVSEHARLALGLQGGFDYYRVRLSDIAVWDNNDPAFLQGDFRKVLPTAGTGIYFNSRYFYAGASVPNFIPSRIFDPYYESLEGRRRTHYFVTSGIVLPIGRGVKFKPSMLLRYTNATPISLDLNASFLFKDIIWLGASLRNTKDLGLMMEVNPTPSLRFGYLYEYKGSNSVVAVSTSTHEFMLGFDLSFRKNKMISPRLF